tara:strand:+ start:3142 stop:4353 length:1212 start_codon:yes stop_codon:yes gene_type:complete
VKNSKIYISVFLFCLAFITAGCMNDLNPEGGWASLLPYEDKIIIPGKDGYLHRMDVNVGYESSWRYPSDESLGAIYGSPTIFNDVIYGSAYTCKGSECTGDIFAVNQTDGTSSWGIKSVKYNSRLIGRVGVTDSMVLFSTGYIFTDGEKSEYPGYFISLDRNSGLMLWRIPLDGESWTGISVSGDIAYLGTLSGSIYAIDLADSNLYDSDPSLRILWKYNTDRAIAGPIFVESNHIIVGDFGNRVMKILPDARRDNLDFPTKSEWVFDTKNWVWAELILDRGVLYAATLSGDIHAIDNLLGTEIWSVNLGDQVVASPVIFERSRGDFREKVLAVPSGDKNISIISIIDGRQLGTLVTRAPIKSSPLIIGETLYTQNTDGQILWFSTLDLSERGCIDLEEGKSC